MYKLEIERIVAKVSTGAQIEHVWRGAIHMACEHECDVRFVFNGQTHEIKFAEILSLVKRVEVTDG